MLHLKLIGSIWMRGAIKHELSRRVFLISLRKDKQLDAVHIKRG